MSAGPEKGQKTVGEADGGGEGPLVGLMQVYFLRQPQPGPAEAPLPSTCGVRGRQAGRKREWMHEVNQVRRTRLMEKGVNSHTHD